MYIGAGQTPRRKKLISGNNRFWISLQCWSLPILTVCQKPKLGLCLQQLGFSSWSDSQSFCPFKLKTYLFGAYFVRKKHILWISSKIPPGWLHDFIFSWWSYIYILWSATFSLEFGMVVMQHTRVDRRAILATLPAGLCESKTIKLNSEHIPCTQNYDIFFPGGLNVVQAHDSLWDMCQNTSPQRPSRWIWMGDSGKAICTLFITAT